MGWTLLFMVVILKIPLAAALWLIWYAVKAEPIPEDGPAGEDRKPRRNPPKPPRSPRRGPRGGAGCWPAPCPQTAEREERRPATAIARRG
jgi:hypothetical protein